MSSRQALRAGETPKAVTSPEATATVPPKSSQDERGTGFHLPAALLYSKESNGLQCWAPQNRTAALRQEPASLTREHYTVSGWLNKG